MALLSILLLGFLACGARTVIGQGLQAVVGPPPQSQQAVQYNPRAYVISGHQSDLNGVSGGGGCPFRRGQFPHERYCDHYYDCWDGRATVRQCPDNLMFNDDPAKLYCDFARNVDCGFRRKTRASLVSEGLCRGQFGVFPDPYDCGAFFTCSYGRPFRQECPDGTLFDEKSRVCDHAYRTRCRSPGGRIRNLQFEPALLSQPARALQQVAGFQCPSTMGLHPYNGDCSLYWLCMDSKPLLQSCPRGMKFDRKRLICDRVGQGRC